MKRVIVVSLAVFAVAVSLYAQGLVNFANTPSTAVYVQEPDSMGPFSIMSAAGTFYFGLFLGQPNATWFFTGIYATNTGLNGLFSGGVVAVPGWAVGTSTNYFVAGWAGQHDFEGIWLTGIGLPGAFGTAGPGIARAGNGTSIPVLNLFDGGSGTIQPGFFQLDNFTIPEPSISAIGAIGIGLLLLKRSP